MIMADVGGVITHIRPQNTVNRMVIRLRALAAEVTRVTLEVGSQGKLGGSAMVEDVEGVWQELTHNVSIRSSYATAAYLCTGQSYVFEPYQPSAVYRRGDNCCGKGRPYPTCGSRSRGRDGYLEGELPKPWLK